MKTNINSYLLMIIIIKFVLIDIRLFFLISSIIGQVWKYEYNLRNCTVGQDVKKFDSGARVMLVTVAYISCKQINFSHAVVKIVYT